MSAPINIPPGQTAPLNPLPVYCQNTGCRKLAIKKCMDCREVLYCTRDHQKLDWEKHKWTCSFNSPPKGSPTYTIGTPPSLTAEKTTLASKTLFPPN